MIYLDSDSVDTAGHAFITWDDNSNDEEGFYIKFTFGDSVYFLDSVGPDTDELVIKLSDYVSIDAEGNIFTNNYMRAWVSSYNSYGPSETSVCTIWW